MQDLTRRQFVTAAAAVTAACAGCPLFNGVADGAGTGAAATPVDIGPAADLADGITSRWAGGGFFVVRRGDRVYAVSSTCTHKKVRLVPSGKAGDAALKCPRHGSVFNAEGRPTKAPARRPLSRYGVRLDERGHVLVDRSSRFGEKDWDDPASFVRVDRPDRREP